jgi:glycosyltransferase involved in cell wall biosynthesis
MPLISIITINLNDQNGLLQTIDSVLSQNHASYEYIIIDGGSTDGSLEIIKRYQKEISYWISETDTGIYSAMNKGIKKATGEYCLFVNSGDVLYSKSTLTDIVNQNLVADIISGNSFVKINRGKAQLVKAPPTISFNTFFVHTILHQATLIRTALFKKVGTYNENLKIVADWEFFVKAFFLHQCSYKQIDITISVFDNNGISSRPENFNISLSERKDTLQKYFPYFISDYNHLQPRSTYYFLENIQKSRILKSTFIFTCRLINKLFKILSV